MNEKYKIAIIGMGYVGLPLAVEFGKIYKTIGFDINKERIRQLVDGHDETLEVERAQLKSATNLRFTHEVSDLLDQNIFIVTVPTPIDDANKPDLGPIKAATNMLSHVIKKNDIVIYESTVYPGVTEDECVPILENGSGLKYNLDFFVGYSPERINPGDKLHRVSDIVKVTSGSDEKTAILVDGLYKSIIKAGTHLASSIKVAEAAKVIENIQRDVNIGLVNEFSTIFNVLGIDTSDVLAAAGTKWNFLPFQPGLVGGHCIGVDPYYLTYKAEQVGIIPQMILAGRRVNEGMAKHVVNLLISNAIREKINLCDEKVLVMGLTFKENCPDIRNTKVLDIVSELNSLGIQTDICDPWVNDSDYGSLIKLDDLLRGSKTYSAAIIAVQHQQFVELFRNTKPSFISSDNIIVDVKGIIPKEVKGLKSIRL